MNKKRESQNFGEIWNIQTDMNVPQEKWDSIFHNWNEPHKCSGRTKGRFCSVCDQIDKYGYVKNKEGKLFNYNIGIIGDVHSNIQAIRDIMDYNPDVATWFCLGDLGIYASKKMMDADKKSVEKNPKNIQKYFEEFQNDSFTPLPKPLYVIKGNHDDYDSLFSNIFFKNNILYLPQGVDLLINNTKIVTLGGIKSPKKIKYDPSKLQGRDRRFYTYSEINNIENQFSYKTTQTPVDIFITHEAAEGYLPNREEKNFDEGKKELKELLDKINPIYYIHGHHHINYETQDHNTKIIGLGNFGKNQSSYIKINSITKELIHGN